jgi:hypothetical protein
LGNVWELKGYRIYDEADSRPSGLHNNGRRIIVPQLTSTDEVEISIKRSQEQSSLAGKEACKGDSDRLLGL